LKNKKSKDSNYENTQHWNLDAEYLKPLKKFIMDKVNI